MPDFGVVAAASKTLKSVLTEALKVLGNVPADLSDLQGTIGTSPARLTIFLFDVGEDPSARNRPRELGSASTDITVRKPPMALLLHYLLTPWSPDPLTDHKIVGRVLQVLYDGAQIGGSDLRGNLAGTSDVLKVTLAPLSLEDRTRVWYAVQKPYRLSLCYQVRVVNLDTEREDRFPAIRRRSINYAVGETVP
jgi:hypothetical protein